MKERGILFRDRLVRAILRVENPKTQTRRLARNFDPDAPPLPSCPYGVPGDRLWVREAWHAAPDGLCFRATGCRWLERADHRTWKPGIHLFRRDARIRLEVMEVRVERLQDISEEGAIAEGLTQGARGAWIGSQVKVGGVLADQTFTGPRDAFASLWDSINGDRPGASWEANPWVWAISFRRVTP